MALRAAIVCECRARFRQKVIAACGAGRRTPERFLSSQEACWLASYFMPANSALLGMSAAILACDDMYVRLDCHKKKQKNIVGIRIA